MELKLDESELVLPELHELTIKGRGRKPINPDLEKNLVDWLRRRLIIETYISQD